jgi:ABC-type multidrug transport system fused ATPase/permease subunit
VGEDPGRRRRELQRVRPDPPRPGDPGLNERRQHVVGAAGGTGVDRGIKMSNMTVTHGAVEEPALRGIQLEMNERDKVAIVGRSGSGKSSMLRTILRFYDPSAGTCALDGVGITQSTYDRLQQMP